MAESTQGRIVIDAQGTEKNVLEPKPIVSENPFKEKAEAAAAGLGAALVVEAVETIKEKIKHTKSEKIESKSGDETETKSYNFGQVETKLMSGKLNKEEEKLFQTVRERQIEEFKDVDNGDFVRDTRIAVTRILKNNDWDDIYDELTHYGETREGEMRGRAEIDDRLNGISMAAVRYEASRVLIAGLQNKKQEVGQKKYEKWIKEEKSDQYSKEEIETLQKLAKRSFVRLAPDAPEELVGRNIKKEEVNVTPEVENLRNEVEVLRDRLSNADNGNNDKVTVEMLKEILGQGSKEEIKRLYRDAEKGMYQIPSGFEVPKFLIGETKEKQDEWQARARLSSSCFMKRMAKGPDELGQNTEAQAITNEQLELLLNLPGVSEAKALESYLIVSKNPLTSLINQIDSVDQDKLNGNIKIQNMPSYLNEIKEGKHLDGFREAKIQWLMTFRKLNREQAEDAEVISRNLTYLANEVEDYDTRYQWRRDDKGGLRQYYVKEYTFTSPTVPQFKSLNAWQLIHPQERLQQKTETGDEAWSLFGTYSLNKYKMSKFVSSIPLVNIFAKQWSVSSEQFYPTRLIPNTFEYDKDGDKKTFMSIFVENGRRLIEDPYTTNISKPNFGGSIGEGPFAGYCFLKLSPASTIFNIITNPSKFDRNWANLGNALRSCNVSSYYREMIALGLHGVVPGIPVLIPKGGTEAYLGTKSGIKASDPNFFN